MIAALVATLHPYLVWHDVHVNREILDGLLARRDGAARASRRTSAARSCSRSLRAPSTGLAILSNARLLLLPLVLAPYVAWRVRPGRRAVAAALVVVVGAAAVTAPWVVRNRVVIGCATITTDTRALWKANNPATYDVLAGGGWIDDVPDLPGVPPWPEKAAGDLGRRREAVDECAQASFYRDEVIDFWRDQPGEKARLAVQAVGMLWSPFLSVAADDPAQQGALRLPQRTVEPAFVAPALRARALGRVPRAAPFRRARRARARLQHAGRDGVRRHRPLPRAVGLRARAARRVRARARLGARFGAPRAGSVERSAVDRLGPVRAALLRELARARARVRPRPSPRRVPGPRRARRSPPASASASPGGTSRPGAAVLDDLRQPADGAGDHRPAALHRLERDHPEALAERRHDDDLGPLEDRRERARPARGTKRRRPSPSRAAVAGARARAGRRPRSRA